MPTVPIFHPNSRFRLESRLYDGTLIAILPHLDLSCNFYLNKADTLTTSIPMWDPKVSRNTLQEGVHELWLWKMYPGTGLPDILVYAGPLWTIVVDSGSKKLQLQSEGLYSYFDKRYIADTFTYNNYYNPWNIARGLIIYTQAQVNGNLNIGVGTSPSDLAYFYQATFYGYEQRRISDTIADLTKQRGFDSDTLLDTAGWEFNIPPSTRTFESYPNQKGEQRDVILRYGGSGSGGNIANYSMQLFGKTIMNSIFVQGPGDGANMLTSRAIDVASREYYGLMQGVVAAKDAASTREVTERGTTALETYKRAKQYPQFSLRSGAVDMFDGSFNIGDSCRLIIDDTYIQYDKIIRVNGFGLTVGSEDQETIVLYSEDDDVTTDS